WIRVACSSSTRDGGPRTTASRWGSSPAKGRKQGSPRDRQGDLAEGHGHARARAHPTGEMHLRTREAGGQCSHGADAGEPRDLELDAARELREAGDEGGSPR